MKSVTLNISNRILEYSLDFVCNNVNSDVVEDPFSIDINDNLWINLEAAVYNDIDDLVDKKELLQ